MPRPISSFWPTRATISHHHTNTRFCLTSSWPNLCEFPREAQPGCHVVEQADADDRISLETKLSKLPPSPVHLSEPLLLTALLGMCSQYAQDMLSNSEKPKPEALSAYSQGEAPKLKAPQFPVQRDGAACSAPAHAALNPMVGHAAFCCEILGGLGGPDYFSSLRSPDPTRRP